jgi:hypothetical protein
LPAFAELKLLPNEVPTKFDVMFSQGIHPIVTKPSKHHGHPEVPVQWPKHEEIIEYVQHVKEELMEAMDDARISARLINLALEREYMHLETLAYMLVQERKKLFEKRTVSMHYLIISSIATTRTTLMLESTVGQQQRRSCQQQL